jgi:hypothetical protein
MKKLLITGMIGIAFITSSFTTPKSENSTVPKEFNKLIATKQVTWKITDQFKKASLIEGGEKIEIFYSNDGNLIGTSKYFAYDKLPKSAIRNISLNYAYPEHNLIECIVFESADHEINYYVSLQKGNNQVNLKINEFGSVEEFQ